MGQATELGWVIEKGEIASPSYWSPSGWSAAGDHLAALRLEREEDAEAIVASFIVGVSEVDRDAIRIAQHGWG